jgi:predicted amidophosphoribosyltransferase
LSPATGQGTREFRSPIKKFVAIVVVPTAEHWSRRRGFLINENNLSRLSGSVSLPPCLLRKRHRH